jgi:hypothetical protein
VSRGEILKKKLLEIRFVPVRLLAARFGARGAIDPWFGA